MSFSPVKLSCLHNDPVSIRSTFQEEYKGTELSDENDFQQLETCSISWKEKKRK